MKRRTIGGNREADVSHGATGGPTSWGHGGHSVRAVRIGSTAACSGREQPGHNSDRARRPGRLPCGRAPGSKSGSGGRAATHVDGRGKRRDSAIPTFATFFPADLKTQVGLKGSMRSPAPVAAGRGICIERSRTPVDVTEARWQLGSS